MKKEEAKQLMCPLQQSETTTIKCIADKCMAWGNETNGEDDGFCELIHGVTGWLSRIAYKIS